METELKAVSRLVVSKKRMSVDEICEALGLSRRQVLYRLEKINQILSSHKVPPVVVGHVLVVDPVTREALLAACQGHARLHEYEFTPAQRQLVLYLMLFEGRDRLILQDFMEALDVSRNTVLADLKQLRQSLEAADIQLVSDRRRGYQLRGEETALRSRLIREVMQEITAIADVQLFDLFLENSGAATFPETEALCLRLAKEHGIRFAADRMTEFIYMYLFLRQRIQNTGIHGDVHWPLPDCPEKRFVQGLLKETGSDGFMVSEEVSWLTSWILGISFGSVYEDTEDCLLIADITGRIMSRFEQLTGIRAPCQEDMFTRLYSHIRPAYYRLLFGIPILNPLTEKVKQEYPDLYQIVARAVKPACSLAGREFPEDEIAYLTMHFAVLYEGMHPAAATSRSRALILCRNGVGSSAVLHAVLTELFPQLAFETADSLDLGPGRMPPDIIFAGEAAGAAGSEFDSGTGSRYAGSGHGAVSRPPLLHDSERRRTPPYAPGTVHPPQTPGSCPGPGPAGNDGSVADRRIRFLCHLAGSRAPGLSAPGPAGSHYRRVHTAHHRHHGNRRSLCGDCPSCGPAAHRSPARCPAAGSVPDSV